jgi:hypothetical protein
MGESVIWRSHDSAQLARQHDDQVGQVAPRLRGILLELVPSLDFHEW